jgi:hypothetical protein
MGFSVAGFMGIASCFCMIFMYFEFFFLIDHLCSVRPLKG